MTVSVVSLCPDHSHRALAYLLSTCVLAAGIGMYVTEACVPGTSECYRCKKQVEDGQEITQWWQEGA